MTFLKLVVTTRQITRTASMAAMVSFVVLGSAITVSAQQAARGFVTVNGAI